VLNKYFVGKICGHFKSNPSTVSNKKVKIYIDQCMRSAVPIDQNVINTDHYARRSQDFLLGK
jgi:hypothetical protein